MATTVDASQLTDLGKAGKAEIVDTASLVMGKVHSVDVKDGKHTFAADELQAIMGVNKDWPYPAEQDGWVMIHNAIRLDMDEVLAAITETKTQLESGEGLTAWQVTHFQKIFKGFYQQVHQHHHHEEAGFFPWMNKRVSLPPKMSADHVTLMALMDKCKSLVEGLKAGAAASQDLVTFTELQSNFSHLRDSMREHFDEEETIGLPILRKNFTRAELIPEEKRILKDLVPADLAYLLWPVSELEGKRKVMTTLGVPTIIQRLLMEPAVKKDDKTRVRMLRELKAGALEGPVRTGCFGCAAR